MDKNAERKSPRTKRKNKKKRAPEKVKTTVEQTAKISSKMRQADVCTYVRMYIAKCVHS